MDLKEMKVAWAPRDYSSPARRRQLVEREFKKVAKAFASVGRSDAWVNEEQRKTELLKIMDRAREEFASIRVHCIEETLTEFETACFTNYRHLEDSFNYTLGATLWVLDELRRSGKLYDAYTFLPASRMEIEEIYTPIDFFHPCYEDDLIQSVAHVLDPRNSTGEWAEQFEGLMGLIAPEKISAAAEKFKTLQWKAIELLLRTTEIYDKKNRQIMQEIENIQNPSVLMVRPVDNEDRTHELAEEGLKLSDDRRTFISHFEDYIGTTERRVMNSRELGKIMGEFKVDDPFEICFALIYMIGTADSAIWSMKTGTAVICAAGRMLPWYVSPEEWDEDEDPWEELSFYRDNDWLEKTSTTADLGEDYTLSSDGKNRAQRVFKLCKGMMPVGFHPFEDEREQMKAEGREDADLIADQAEILFLSLFRASAGNFRSKHWWENDDIFDEIEEKAEEKEIEALPQQPVKIRGLWGKVAEEQGRQVEERPITPVEPEDNSKELLERAKKEIKNLKSTLAMVSREADSDRAKYEHELRALRMEHCELADLRSLVFNINTADPAKVEKVERQISYPYSTRKRIVVFGGHDSFLRAIKPMLPEVKFVDTDQYGFAPEIVRNADVVWVQTNCISHSQYNNITRLTRQYGIQLRYFGYASAEKCAEQLVTEDEK